jgi:hypothetical protein
MLSSLDLLQIKASNSSIVAEYHDRSTHYTLHNYHRSAVLRDAKFKPAVKNLQVKIALK